MYGTGSYRALSKAWEEEVKKKDDKAELREKWRELIGFDIFYLYFKAKEIEDWIKERVSFKLFGMKGRPQFNKNKILYVFKGTF